MLETSDLYKSSLGISMVLAFLFAVPLSYLIWVQTQNFLLNQTTNMRFGRFNRIYAGSDAALHVNMEELMRESDDEDFEGNFRDTSKDSMGKRDKMSLRSSQLNLRSTLINQDTPVLGRKSLQQPIPKK